MINFSANYISTQSLTSTLVSFFEEKVEQYYRLSSSEKHLPKEDLLHEALLREVPFIIPNIDAATLKAISIAVRPVGRPTYSRGRPPTYVQEYKDLRHVREFRGWLLNKLVAHALAVPLHELPPPIKGIHNPDSPVETLLQMQRFEAASGVTLPHRYWITHTREDRVILRNNKKFWDECLLVIQEPLTQDWAEEGKTCIKFEEYTQLRKNLLIRPSISTVLSSETPPEFTRLFIENLDKELSAKQARAKREVAMQVLAKGSQEIATQTLASPQELTSQTPASAKLFASQALATSCIAA